MTKLFSKAALLAFAAMAPLAAHSETAAGDWHWTATAYVWLPSLGGETAFPSGDGGPSIDVSGDAILDSLNMAFMGALEARKGAWTLSTDVIYLDLGASQEATRDFGIGQTEIPADVSANLRLDVTGWLWTVAGSYAVLQRDNMSVNLLAGARMLDLAQDLRWQINGDISNLPVLDRTGSSTAKATQWDAIAGVKGRWTFGADRQWYVPFYIDVGAGESDLTWQAMTGLGYSFNSIDVTGAWRYLDYDFGDSAPIKSIDFNGPALGFSFRF